MHTKLISELEYLQFKGSFRKILIQTLIGFIIGMILGGYSDSGWFGIIFFGILLAGMPYAWSVIPVFAFGVVSIIIKIIVAICLGWVITPIAFIYNFIQMKRYEKSVLQHVMVENMEKESKEGV